MIKYLIAKYVDDLARNEPINVGVVASDGENIVARFDGENDAQKVDLRHVRHRISGSHAYRAWVHYWRVAIADPRAVGVQGESPSPANVLDFLVGEGGSDFYIEPGGEILVDHDERSLEESARELYEKLVKQPDPPSPMSLQEKSRQALASAGAPMDDKSRFRDQFMVKLDVEGVQVEHEVSYAVMNGKWHYLQEMPFDPGKPRVSRKEASHCAFLFEHAGWGRDDCAILYDGSDLSESSSGLLEMLESFAPLVDVDRTDDAAKALHESLNLAEH
jgi:hypothetical protein